MKDNDNHSQLENKALKVILDKLCADSLWDAVEMTLKRSRRQGRWWDNDDDGNDDKKPVIGV